MTSRALTRNANRSVVGIPMEQDVWAFRIGRQIMSAR
jgi:hypothetical protein